MDGKIYDVPLPARLYAVKHFREKITDRSTDFFVVFSTAPGGLQGIPVENIAG